MGKIRLNTSILIIAIVGIFASVFFAKPWYGAIKYLGDDKNVIDSRTAAYVKKADLLNNLSQFDPLTHEGKSAFRLTVPVIMKIFNLDFVQTYELQLCLGPIIIILLTFLFYEATGSLMTTLLMTLAASCTYFCRSYFIDTYISFDTFCYFFLALALLFRKQPIVLFVSVVALFFADERGILAISIIWLAIKFMDRKPDTDLTLRELFSLNDASKFVFAGLLLATGLRMLLHFHYGLSTPLGNVSLGFFFMTWRGAQLGIWSGLACFWGFILLGIATAYAERKFILGTLILSCFSILIAATLIVADRTKSSAYAFPLAIICLKYLHANTKDINKILFLVMCVNMLVPASINPSPEKTLYFFPYAFDIISGIFNSIHNIRHAL